MRRMGVFGVVLCLVAATANATLIQYHYEGVVVGLDDYHGVGYALPATVGDSFAMTLVVAGDTPDADPANTQRGVYQDAVKGWSISINGQALSVQTDPSASQFEFGDGIFVDNDAPVYPYVCPGDNPGYCDYPGDFLQIYGSSWIADSGQRYSLSIFFFKNFFGQFLNSDELPLTEIDLLLDHGNFSTLQVFDSTGASSNIYLEPTAVPVPSVVWLFGGALGGLGALRRRQATASPSPRAARP